MKTLYLMRHGETMFNRQHRIQGWCDSPLTDRGREQARVMGALLRERGAHFDAAYCSTAERASDTLELVLAELEPARRPDTYERLKGLREMFYGDLEAQQDFLAGNDPEACRTYYLQFGGESSDAVRDRMVATLAEVMMRPRHDAVLAVAHGGANFNFLRAIEDPMPVLNAGWGNCTTCVYTFDEARADEQPDGAGAGPWRLVEVLRLP